MSNWWEAEEPIALKVELKKHCPHCDQPFSHTAMVQITGTNVPYRVTCTNCHQESEVVWNNDSQDGDLSPTFTKLPLKTQLLPPQAQT